MDRKPSSFVYGMNQPGLVLCCLIYAPSLYGGLMWMCGSMHRPGTTSLQHFYKYGKARSSRREKHFSRKKIKYLPSPCQWLIALHSALWSRYIDTQVRSAVTLCVVLCVVYSHTLILSYSQHRFYVSSNKCPTVPISSVFACSKLRS